MHTLTVQLETNMIAMHTLTVQLEINMIAMHTVTGQLETSMSPLLKHFRCLDCSFNVLYTNYLNLLLTLPKSCLCVDVSISPLNILSYISENK